MKVTVIPIVIGALNTVTKRGLGNKRTCEEHPSYGIIKIGQNTEKCPGDLRKLSLAQTPKNLQNIRQSHKVYHEGHKKLVSGISRLRNKNSLGENPERYLPSRCAFIVTVSKRNDAIQSKNLENAPGLQI